MSGLSAWLWGTSQLDDAIGMLLEMHDKLSQAVKLYDQTLTEQNYASPLKNLSFPTTAIPTRTIGRGF
ncbi:hypothetical protein AN958_12485 [Leucoagaricus sp. SymC.cos]|nr:hypothetical protein AN958_12485 [Leucoagaricus sp. SymC.cos]